MGHAEGALPVPRSSFVGRAEELGAVRAALGEHRLVTVTGLGGTGKTRLALEAAAAVAGTYRDGARFVELAPVATVEGIVAAVTSALAPAAPRRPDGDPVARLAAAARHLEVLLVVDNCEHVLADATRVVDELLDRCPLLTVLATSREPLRVAGERTVTAHPFSVGACTPRRPSPAVRLFADRAAAVRGDFVLDDDTIGDVTAICRQVDGIALAVELAAARVAHLSPAEIARRLDDPGALASRDRTAAARHHSLAATLDWSYDLLDAVAQAVFRRLSVLVGGADIAAVEAVCGDDLDGTDVVEVVSALVDGNLVTVEERRGASRYRTIETVRRYAAARLEAAGEAPATRRRHARWLLDRARDRGDDAGAELADGLDDVVAALRWATDAGETDLALALAGATWRSWEVAGRHPEGRGLIGAALDLPAPRPSPDRARALVGAASLALSAGDLPAARRGYEASIADLRALGLERELAGALNSRAVVALFEGDAGSAGRLAAEALGRFEALGDRGGAAFARSGLGMIAARAGRLDEAERHFLDALRDLRQIGLKREAASVLNNLGNLAADAGEAGRAHRFYEGALQLQREVGDERGAALSLNNLCLAAQQRGNLDRAWEHADAARELFRDLGDRPGEAATVNNLANLAAERGNPGQAVELYGECIRAFQEIGDARRLATSFGNLADLAAAIGERQLAWDCLLDAVSLWNQLGDRDRVRDGLGELARLAAAWGIAGGERLGGAAAAVADPAAVSHALESARWLPIPPAPRTVRATRDGELTAREEQVVVLVGRGLTNAAIAAELFISERTVESHVSNARLKLGLDSRTKLTRWAVERGLVG